MSAEPIAPLRDDDEIERLTRIEQKLDMLIDAHNDMVVKVNDIIENVKPHLDDIGPMLDAIANHPMLRMFVGGSKKDKKKVQS